MCLQMFVLCTPATCKVASAHQETFLTRAGLRVMQPVCHVGSFCLWVGVGHMTPFQLGHREGVKMDGKSFEDS